MTDRIALYLGLFIAAVVLADIVLTGGVGTLFLIRKFLILMDWVAFWR